MAIGSYFWSLNNVENHYYLKESTNYATDSVLRYLTYFILFNTMIPISLIVTLEMVKVVQAYFISKDEEMYVPDKNKYCNINTSSINEELG
jgi:magnesium-transporting ATPase (P-type)